MSRWEGQLYRGNLQEQSASVQTTSTVQRIVTAICKLYSTLPDTTWNQLSVISALSSPQLGWAVVSSVDHWKKHIQNNAQLKLLCTT